MNTATASQCVGIVGLGLMGQGIAACLLAHGHTVIGYDQNAAQQGATRKHVHHALNELKKRKQLRAIYARTWEKRLVPAKTIDELAPCTIVIECVREDLAMKRALFKQLEGIVRRSTILASNTSSLPVTLLQQDLKIPSRVVGMHWGEPAQIMRYLEIIPGEQTSKRTLRNALAFGRGCGKEPAVLQRDIRGFLSNRLMYAMLREACHLVETGIADIETVDQSFRNDIGWWALLAGPFRWMDLTGIPAYAAVMDGLLPELCNDGTTPRLMQNMVKKGALGIANAKGFYPYTKATAHTWERDWERFTYEMKAVAERYTPVR